MRTHARWLLGGSLAFVGAACGGSGGGLAPAAFTTGPVTSLGGSLPFDVAIAYFDADAAPDLFLPGGIGVGPGGLEFGARVFLGRADGTYAPTAPVTVGVATLFEIVRAIPGHFDDGARTDCLLVAGPSYGLLLGNGDGTFDAAGPALKVFQGGIVATDADRIDGDGNLHDDFVIGTTNGHVVVFLGDGAGGFQLSDDVPVAPGKLILDVAVADLDGDDIDDVVALDSDSGVTVLFGDLAGGVAFGSSIVGGLPGRVQGIVVGEFDDANGLDLAILAGPLPTPTPHVNVTIVTGDGSGGFGVIDGAVDLPQETFGVPARGAVAWLDSFAKPDLVVGARSASGDMSLYRIRLDALGVPVADAIEAPAHVVTFRAADLDDDLRTDLLVVSEQETGLDLAVRILYGIAR